MEDINFSFFSRFRPSVFDKYTEALHDDHQREATFAALKQYLASWNDSEWLDDENLYFLGKDIGFLTPNQYLEQLQEYIDSDDISQPVKIAFKAGYETGDKIDEIKVLPNRNQFETTLHTIVTSELNAAFSSFSAMFQRYISYSEFTGEIFITGRACLKLYQAICSRPDSEFLKIHNIVHKEILRIFSVDTNNDCLWYIWADSFAKAGDFAAKEVILWDAIRRNPASRHLAFHLMRALKANRYNYQNRIRLSWYFAKTFNFHPQIMFQYYATKGYSNITSQAAELVKQFAENAGRSGFSSDERSLFAAILNKQWERFSEKNLTEDVIDSALSALTNRPDDVRIIASILYRNQAGHAALYLLELFSHKQKGLEKSKTDNLRAKIIAADGLDEDINAAIEILESHSDTISANHIASLLVRRSKEGDLSEAEQILRATMDEGNWDNYTVNQLADLLINSGYEAHIEEAKELLKVISDDDEFSRKKLAALETGAYIPPNASDADNRIDELTEDDTEFLSMLETIDMQDINYKSKNLYAEIPPLVVQNSQLRKAHFELEYGTAKSRDEAAEFLSSQQTSPENQYRNFLGIIYLKESYVDGGIGVIGARLLTAFRNNDISSIHNCVREVPRLVSIADLALAKAGDEAARQRTNILAATSVKALSVEKQRISLTLRNISGNNWEKLNVLLRDKKKDSLIYSAINDNLVAMMDEDIAV